MLVECHPHADPDAWLLENPGFVSGGNLRWWRDQFAPIERGAEAEGLGDAYDLLSLEAARVPPGAEGLVFLPAMQGAMAPEWNGAARGVFYGLTLAHSRAHMTRALLEGSAFGLRDILEAMTVAGLDVRRLTIVGGGAKGPVVASDQGRRDRPPGPRPRKRRDHGDRCGDLATVGAGPTRFRRRRGRCVRRVPPRRARARPGAPRGLRRRLPAVPRRVFRPQAGLRGRGSPLARPRGAATAASHDQFGDGRDQDGEGSRRDNARRFTDHDQNIPSAIAAHALGIVRYQPVALSTSRNERNTYSGSQTSNPPPTSTHVPPTPTAPISRGYARRRGRFNPPASHRRP